MPGRGEGPVPVHPLWRPFAPYANAARQGLRVASRQTPPGGIRPYSAQWPRQYRELHDILLACVPEQVVAVQHVGSTAVPGLLAKPVIDIDLTVPDVEDEPAYLPGLEAAGFRLIFRDDVAGDPHRHLTFPAPNANLHVWSPGACEPRRHALFTQHLRTHPEDRERYAAAKQAARAAPGAGRYNDLKAATVYDIYERAFLADPRHPHVHRPRPDPG